jgi:hypothetical protein
MAIHHVSLVSHSLGKEINKVKKSRTPFDFCQVHNIGVCFLDHLGHGLKMFGGVLLVLMSE